MSDDIHDPGLDGKVVWPINEGDIVEWEDAYATLFDISDAQIQVSHYHQNGNDLTGDLEIHLSGQEAYADAPATYFAKPLKQALEEALEMLVDADATDEHLAEFEADEEWRSVAEHQRESRPAVRKSRGLTELLLKAYAEWEAHNGQPKPNNPG